MKNEFKTHYLNNNMERYIVIIIKYLNCFHLNAQSNAYLWIEKLNS